VGIAASALFKGDVGVPTSPASIEAGRPESAVVNAPLGPKRFDDTFAGSVARSVARSLEPFVPLRLLDSDMWYISTHMRRFSIAAGRLAVMLATLEKLC
jgi:hypothetical protein